MSRLRLLYLGHRYMPMRPDTLLIMTVMLVIIGAGAITLYMDIEQPALLTVGVGLVVTALQVAVMIRFPGIADGLSWSGLIIEELKSTRGVMPGGDRGLPDAASFGISRSTAMFLMRLCDAG
ncbi:hypothetical protein [Halomonas sp. E19]|uniref:hypothetical protein n=1 Tax=Halomonas sp. E19 TaxID=3397247 RepID=UPI0040340070